MNILFLNLLRSTNAKIMHYFVDLKSGNIDSITFYYNNITSLNLTINLHEK